MGVIVVTYVNLASIADDHFIFSNTPLATVESSTNTATPTLVANIVPANNMNGLLAARITSKGGDHYAAIGPSPLDLFAPLRGYYIPEGETLVVKVQSGDRVAAVQST